MSIFGWILFLKDGLGRNNAEVGNVLGVFEDGWLGSPRPECQADVYDRVVVVGFIFSSGDLNLDFLVMSKLYLTFIWRER